MRLGALTKLWNTDSLAAICDKMSLSEIVSLRDALSEKADELYPPLVQFSGEKETEISAPEKEYMI